jgi:hypothetical protein
LEVGTGTRCQVSVQHTQINSVSVNGGGTLPTTPVSSHFSRVSGAKPNLPTPPDFDLYTSIPLCNTAQIKIMYASRSKDGRAQSQKSSPNLPRVVDEVMICASGKQNSARWDRIVSDSTPLSSQVVLAILPFAPVQSHTLSEEKETTLILWKQNSVWGVCIAVA